MKEAMSGKYAGLHEINVDELLPEQDRPALTLDSCHLNTTSGAILCSLVQVWLESQLSKG